MNLEQAATEIEAHLAQLGTPERARQEKAYLKSDLEFLGLTVFALVKVAREWNAAHRDVGDAELRLLVERLWASPTYDLRRFAVELLVLRAATLQASDLPLLERMLRESRTWALVDEIAPSVVGPLYERDASVGETLDRWAQDDDFWLRRAALLTLLLPLRRGQGDWERFTRYATAMLPEREFFIRKAICWVLRETSKKQPERVREYVAEHAGQMSGLTFKEATRRLPEADQVTLTELRARSA